MLAAAEDGHVSWYDSNYKYRLAITVDNTAGGAGAADVTISIPYTLELFWSTVLSSGEDVRVTLGDGVTLATFDLDSFSKANKVGTIEIDNVTLVAACSHVLYLYWGYASATTGVSAFVPAAPKTGYIEQGKPADPVVVVTRQKPGETRSRDVISKIATETVQVWFDFRNVLERRTDPYATHLDYEEISYAVCDVTVNGSSSGASLITVADTRVITTAQGGGIVAVLVKGGASGTNYTVEALVTTSKGFSSPARVLSGRCTMKVYNVSEV